MLRIAICDDDARFLEGTLNVLLKSALAQLQAPADISMFTDGRKLLDKLRSHDRFDIIILDVEMPSINGKELAGKLRMLDGTFHLIFVTAYPAEVYNTLQYRVDAFIPKEALPERLPVDLKRVITEIEQDKPQYEFFDMIDGNGRKHRLKLVVNDIFCLSCITKSIYLHTCNEQYLLVNKKFEYFVDKYIPLGFFEICRGYLVNLIHVKMVNSIDLVMDNNVRLPVSRRRQKLLLESLSRMISQEVYF